MSVIVPKTSMQWTETAIRDGALKFLSDKNEQLNECISLLKTATMENGDVHAQPTKLARERVCKLAIEAGKEINNLKFHAFAYLDNQYLADPESDETKKLTKIAFAAKMGLSYFNDVAATSRPDYSSSLYIKFFKKINETSHWGNLLLLLPTSLSLILGFPRISLANSYIDIEKHLADNPDLDLTHTKDISTRSFDEGVSLIQQAVAIMVISYAVLSMTSLLVTSRFPSSPLPTPAEIHLKQVAFSKALGLAADS